MPDQLIVNEYQPGQGISAHIDCEPCFKNTIVTVSLGSVYEMDFISLCLVPIFRSTVILSILLLFHPFFGHGLFRAINSYSLVSKSSRREHPLMYSRSLSGSNGFQKFGNTCFVPRQNYFSPRCFISKGGGFPRVLRGFLKSLL